MKKYIIIFKNQILTRLNYRFDFIISTVGTFVSLLMSVFVWNAIYQYTNTTYTYDQLIFYLVLTNFLSLIFNFSPIFRFSSLQYSGKLNTLLLKPINLLLEGFADFLGKQFLPIITALPILAYTIIKFETQSYLLYAIVYFFLSLFMFYMLVSTISVLSFWLINIWPLRPILTGMYSLFAGIYFPLDMFPEKILKYIKYNPFSIIGHYVPSILLGNITLVEINTLTIYTLLYSIIFYFLYKILLHRGMKRYDGGMN